MWKRRFSSVGECDGICQNFNANNNFQLFEHHRVKRSCSQEQLQHQQEQQVWSQYSPEQVVDESSNAVSCVNNVDDDDDDDGKDNNGDDDDEAAETGRQKYARMVMQRRLLEEGEEEEVNSFGQLSNDIGKRARVQENESLDNLADGNNVTDGLRAKRIVSFDSSKLMSNNDDDDEDNSYRTFKSERDEQPVCKKAHVDTQFDNHGIIDGMCTDNDLTFDQQENADEPFSFETLKTQAEAEMQHSSIFNMAATNAAGMAGIAPLGLAADSQQDQDSKGNCAYLTPTNKPCEMSYSLLDRYTNDQDSSRYAVDENSRKCMLDLSQITIAPTIPRPLVPMFASSNSDSMVLLAQQSAFVGPLALVPYKSTQDFVSETAYKEMQKDKFRKLRHVMRNSNTVINENPLREADNMEM